MLSSTHLLQRMYSTIRSNRKQFLKYITLAFLPFIVVSIIVNFRFLKTQADHTVSIVNDVSLQASSQLSSLYKTSAGIAQNITNGTVLQDNVLLSNAKATDYQLINRNILNLQSMVKTYLFFDQIASIRFFLPENLIIADGNMLLYDHHLADVKCYDYYIEHLNLHRWYVTDAVLDSGDQSCVSLLSAIRDPLDFMKIVGSLSVDIDRAYVLNIMQSGMILDHTECYIIDALGNTILHIGELEEALPSDARISHWAQDEGLMKHVKLGCVPYLFVSQPVVDSDMYLAYLVPISSITRNNLMNYALQILLMLLEIVIVMLMAAMLAFIAINSKNNRLKLLHQQINPHFLYNALDMINWKAINYNMPDIYRPIQKLSRFYKLTLNHGLDFIRLKEEFDQLSLYLELQGTRFKNRMTYELHFDPTLADCVILHMILQPIVENAILHGILEHDSQSGHIDIAAKRQGDELLISIRDTGVGMADEAIKRVFQRRETKGFGLDSVQERIHLFYGKRYGITIHSATGQGTCVDVLFPINRDAG